MGTSSHLVTLLVISKGLEHPFWLRMCVCGCVSLCQSELRGWDSLSNYVTAVWKS